MQFVLAIWTFIRGVFALFWLHWGPVTMMFLRTLIHLAMVLILVISGLFENLGIVCNRISRALDWVRNKLQDLLDLIT